MSEEDLFDLSFTPTDETGLRVEVTSRRKGYIATMVDTNLRDMSMCRVSIADHLTEPRGVGEYVIRSLASIPGARVDSLPEGTWVLFHNPSPSWDAVLGCVSDEVGALAMLAYIRDYFDQSLH